MSNLKRVIILCLVAFVFSCQAQSNLEIQLFDKEHSEAIEFASVLLSVEEGGKIIDFKYSDALGKVTLKRPTNNQQLFLKITHIQYQDYKRTLIFDNAVQNESLTIHLLPTFHDLTEVVVTAEIPPIIIKQDTVIYDIKQWASEHDQTLEDVLASMADFEVKSDGEIVYKGNNVHKVLIDGEEVSDGGAALITRSISPEMIKSVEVRTKEKDEQIINSLLDNHDFIVLDIKLKSDINKRLFGKTRLTAGQDKAFSLGGYSNLFSFNKFSKLHLILDVDDFGEQSVKLQSVKNIGSEAFAALFEIPVHFSTFKTRKQYNREVFGFDDYYKSKIKTLGLTGVIPINERSRIFIGTFNWIIDDQKLFESRQEFSTTEVLNSNSNLEEKMASSKNKIEYNYSSKRLKINTDLNAVFENANNELLMNTITANKINFSKEYLPEKYYANLFGEYKAHDKLGLQLKVAANKEDVHTNNTLDTDQNSLISAIQLIEPLGQNIIKQERISKVTNSAIDLSSTFFLKIGSLKSGIQFFTQNMDISKTFLTKQSMQEGFISLHNSRFSGNNEDLSFQFWKPYSGISFSLLGIQFDSKVSSVFQEYRHQEVDKFNQIEFSNNIVYDFNDDNSLMVSWKNEVSMVPIQNLSSGYELLSFQEIAAPMSRMVLPKKQNIGQFSLSNSSIDKGWASTLEAVYGNSNSNAAYETSFSPIVFKTHDQLNESYILAEWQLTKVYEKLPFFTKFITSYIYNVSTNKLDDLSYKNSINRFFVEFKIYSSFEEKPYEFNLKTKYSNFRFVNSELPDQNINKILSIAFEQSYSMLHKKLLLSIWSNYSRFSGDGNGSYINLKAACRYKLDKFIFSLIGDNLLDNQSFFTQNSLPNYFIANEQFTFRRFVKLGVQYQFGN